ncbi:MAG: hypothetical protein EOP84_13360 [Verrucomicrobiaceae bacterium]|nr:MAG: hypothetical protein EOP84_13360 [Verrucomicrobiaceae bacterium]
MKQALHFWKAFVVRLGGLIGFKSETSPTEAPLQGHQTNYSPTSPTLQPSLQDRTTVWNRWEQVAPLRMTAFCKPSIDTCPLDPAARYIWGNHLAAAIMPAMHTFEIAYRNSIHASLSTYYGQADWYDRQSLLLPDELKFVRDAKRKLRRASKPETPDAIVAELMLGFWCALLNSPYDTSVYRPCLSRGFKKLPPHLQSRTTLHSKVIAFKDLRNRVFHHEPIWNIVGLDQTEGELWALAEALYPEFSILSKISLRSATSTTNLFRPTNNLWTIVLQIKSRTEPYSLERPTFRIRIGAFRGNGASHVVRAEGGVSAAAG